MWAVFAAHGNALLGHLDHFKRARAMRQTAEKPALLERRNQPVNARFRAQLDRLFHLLEGGGGVVALHMGIDEEKEFELLFGQHVAVSTQNRTNKKRSVSVLGRFRAAVKALGGGPRSEIV